MRRRVLASLLLLLLLDFPAFGQPREFRDCSDCPVMIALLPGTLTLPAPPPEPRGRRRGAAPAPVRLTVGSGVSLGKFPVTRDEFQAFIQASGYQVRDSDCFHLPEQDGRSFHGVPGSWREPPFDPPFVQTGEHPVVCISRNDALAYVAWLSQRTGHRYRLPAQVEWEYAARAGTVTPRYWTEGPDQACLYANGADRTLASGFGTDPATGFLVPCEDRFVFTSPVGSHRPNAFGFHDMLGNVRQIMEDCAPGNNLIDPTIRVGPQSEPCFPIATVYFVRGSSWMQGLRALDVEVFFQVSQSSPHSSVGFRVARSE